MVLWVALRGKVVRGALVALPGRLVVPVEHHNHPILVGGPRKGAPLLEVVVVEVVIRGAEDQAMQL